MNKINKNYYYFYVYLFASLMNYFILNILEMHNASSRVILVILQVLLKHLVLNSCFMITYERFLF